MDNSGTPPVAGDDEWLREPDGFYNIKFGSTKEDSEKHVTFEQYGISGDAWGLRPDDPYPTLGVTRFSFAKTDITASLIFHPTGGLHCIQGTFPTDQFEGLKSAFLNLYGQPHEVTSGIPQISEEVLKTIPAEHLHHFQTRIESLLWYSANVYVYLVDRELSKKKGHFLIATYSYMRSRGGGEKMSKIAMRKLACTREEYTPPAGWPQEPDDFNGLKLDMTKAEAERHVSFGKCTVTTQEVPGFPTREHFLYDTTLNVGGLAIPGEVLFVEDRLINLGGKFDRPHWDVVRPAFIELYGRPHVDEQREIFEQGLSRRLEWQGDKVRICLLDFPDGTNFGRFSFSQTLKGRQLKLVSAWVPSKATNAPRPERPKIAVEHAPLKLVLRLPDVAYGKLETRAVLQGPVGLPGTITFNWGNGFGNLGAAPAQLAPTNKLQFLGSSECSQ